MAYSGFQDSFSKGSAEDFDVCCDPCSTTGVNIEAKGFCSDCQENLCKTCLDAHKKTKASRHHQLLGQAKSKQAKRTTQTKPEKGTTQQQSSTTCTEACQVHQSEVIKFFCPAHDAVGCNDCMTLHHRTCNIKYIPDICYKTSKVEEFTKTLQGVKRTIDQAEKITKEVKITKDANKESLEEAIREIENFQREIIARLELLKQTMIQQAQTERTSKETNIDQTMRTVVQGSTTLKIMESAMKDSQSDIRDARAFVIMKLAQSKMRELNIQSFENDQNKYRIRCIFKPNEVLEDVVSSLDGLGKLNIVPDSDLMTNLKALTLTETINVRTKSDTEPCDITCCAVLSLDRTLLADWNNKKLKILDIVQQIVVGEKTMEDEPYDIAILPQNQAAVSLPKLKSIIIFMTNSQLETVRSIPVKKLCYGFVYHQDLLYVLCFLFLGPDSLLVLDIQGNIQRDVTLPASIISDPFHIVACHDWQHLYISAKASNVVAKVTLQGNVTDVYRNDEMKGPRGLIVLQDGSLLVCCLNSANIYYVSSDLKQGHTLVGSLPKAKSICYHPNRKTFFVGSQNCDQLNVFKPNSKIGLNRGERVRARGRTREIEEITGKRKFRENKKEREIAKKNEK